MDEKDSPPVRAPGHGHLARKALAASILATALFLVASWNVPAHYSDTFSRDTVKPSCTKTVTAHLKKDPILRRDIMRKTRAFTGRGAPTMTGRSAHICLFR